MYYIDVHCHLTGDEFEGKGGVEQIVKNAEEAGVRRIICSGYDLHSSKLAKDLSERFEGVYFSAGVHPGELQRFQTEDLRELEALCAHPKCVAVGEIGLDYHFEENMPKSFQRTVFVRQLAIADKVGLPVVIHSRDAAQDTLDVLEEYKGLLNHGGVMHCYSYSPEMAERFWKLGLSFSFGGPCTFKNASKVWESVCRIPADRILSETDCPYLTPVPKRGEFPNEPCNVTYVTQRLAELRETPLEQMQEQIVKNAEKLFFKLK